MVIQIDTLTCSRLDRGHARLTYVLFVRLLQKEGLESSCRLLHQGIDDIMEGRTGNLAKRNTTVYL